MIKKIFILITIILAVIQVNSQTVGLVLSGGGAKGMAHVAVIRELEKNNIPIDYIAGTSIGAIVAGLYAAGYTTDQMEELFKSDDFYFWSTGQIQREYRYYFKNSEPDPTWLQLSLAKKKEKVKLLPPTSLIPAEQMDFAFMELTASTSAACHYDFNQLMIPFFCVASDVKNNKPVILRSGDLGNAIRASMTVPFYFKPIEIDGNLLFDGGILNNFPTDYMKQIFKPDIIIGHTVAKGNRSADPDDLMGQISEMIMRPTNFNIDPKDGILLETKFDEIGLLDFNKIEIAMEKGQQTAIAALDSIKNLVTRRVSQEEVDRKRNNFKALKPGLYFQSIQVEGVKDPMQRQFIIESIKHRSDVVSLPNLKTEYFKLVADQHLKSIQPIAYYDETTGFFDLHLKVEPEKKFDLNFGGNVSTKPINQGFAGFNLRSYNRRAYTLSSNLYFGRFYSSFKVGARIDYPTRLPFYLSYYFTMNRWDYYASSTELFFEDVRPPYIIQDELNLRMEGGLPLGLHSKLYSGIAYTSSGDEYYADDEYYKDQTPDKTNFDAFVTQIGLENNSLNYKQYATEGSMKSINLKYVFGSENYHAGSTAKISSLSKIDHNYFLINGIILKYFKLGRRFTLGTHAEATFSNNELFRTYKSTKLATPGFKPTPHSKSLFLSNFHSNNYLAGGLKTIINLTNTTHLRFEGYGFVPLKEELTAEGQSVYRNTNVFDNYYLQGMASLVYQTGIGPASLSLNYYDKQNTQWYVTLNFGYILFNKRGL